MCTKLCIIYLVVQWLRLHASNAEAQVRSLVGEVHIVWHKKKKSVYIYITQSVLNRHEEIITALTFISSPPVQWIACGPVFGSPG